MNNTLYNKYPELKDLVLIIRSEIQQTQRPATEIILDDEDVMKMLKICKRTLQYLKSDGIIPYHLIKSRSYYLLSDILELLKENRIDGVIKGVKIT